MTAGRRALALPAAARAAIVAIAALALSCASSRATLRGPPGEAPSRLAEADRAHAALDPAAEARALLALLAGAPRHPLAQLAIRRLDDLSDLSPAIAREVDAGLAAALAAGRLDGTSAFRARAVRASIAGDAGDAARASALRAENGTVTAFAVLGPFGALAALDLDRTFLPEAGAFPARAEGAPGVGPIAARAIPVPDATLALEGEPPGADVWYLAADVQVARGGDHLAAFGSGSSFRAWLDGAPLAERRDHERFLPLSTIVPVRLPEGRHRLLVKLARGNARGAVTVSFPRADGAPAAVTSAPATPGEAAPAARRGPFPRPLAASAAFVAALEPELGPVRARVLAARDAVEPDREGAKRLLAEARTLLPPEGDARRAALEAELEGVAARAAEDDPTVPPRVARARTEASLERAARLAPEDGSIALERARLASEADRNDDAAARLAALPAGAAERPLAILARARVDLARGSTAAAERLAQRAHREGGLCGATELLYDAAGRRDAAALQDELVTALARCPEGGRRLAEHRARRGDLAGAVALREARARAAPSGIEPRDALARALVAAGDPGRAAAEWADLARLWPRDPRIEKRRAEALEAAGDAAGARAARERALRLDPSDLALRRALAVDAGTAGAEPLEDLAEDGDAALAAYRAAHPPEETPSVFVLDAAAVEVHEGGAYTERVHQIVKVRDAGAADRWGEVPFPPGAQVLRLRTVKRDGRVLEPPAIAGDKGTVSLPGLEPGDFAEWEWLRGVPARGAALPGFTADAFAFRGDTPLWKSRYVVRAPAGTALRVETRAMAAPPVRREGAWEVLRASADAAPPLAPEPAAPEEQEYAPSVRVGSGAGLDAIADVLGDGFLTVSRPSAEVTALAEAVRAGLPAGARRGEPLVRAVYERVAREILGSGGSLGEGAGAVLARGRGSRLVLLAGLYRALGVEARLAMVRERAKDPSPASFPRPDLYARPVLRVRDANNEWWLDPSQRLAPFATLPPQARGQEALLATAPGAPAERVRTPDGPAAEPRLVEVTATLAEDGSALVEGAETYVGWDAAAAKTGVEHADERQRHQAVEQMLSRSFRGVSLERLAVEGEREAGPLVVRWSARVPAWARVEQGRAVIDLPLYPARLGAEYAARARREAPLVVSSGDDARLVLTVKTPPGWKAVASRREVKGARGAFTREDRAEGAGLVREERLVLAPGRVGPEEYPAFARFANEVDAAQGAPIVFERAEPRAQRP